MAFVRSFRDVRANILIEKKRKRIEKNERGSAARSFSNLREHETNLGRRPRVAGGVGGRRRRRRSGRPPGDSIKGELCTLCVTVGFLRRRFLNEARLEGDTSR